MSVSNPSLVCTVGRLLSSWSKPSEEVATLEKGALVILLTRSTPFSLRMAQLKLSEKSYRHFKAATICWRVSLGTLKICLQFRRTGMASKVAKVLSVSVGEFSCLPFASPISSSTSKHEVILTASRILLAWQGLTTHAHIEQWALNF